MGLMLTVFLAVWLAAWSGWRQELRHFTMSAATFVWACVLWICAVLEKHRRRVLCLRDHCGHRRRLLVAPPLPLPLPPLIGLGFERGPILPLPMGLCDHSVLQQKGTHAFYRRFYCRECGSFIYRIKKGHEFPHPRIPLVPGGSALFGLEPVEVD